LANGRPVRTDALVDAVWGESPPGTAVKTVQKYISYLRAQLDAPGLIASRTGGYELVAPDLDSRLFDDLVDRAGAEVAPDRVAALLVEALDLWRGEPYGDLPELAAAQAERRRLGERRMSAMETLADARLALGQNSLLVGWLQPLVVAHPLRERLSGVLMLALYRCGRQAEALAVFGRLRTTLVEDLGLEPTPELQALHRRILRQDDEPTSAPVARRTHPGSLPLHLTGFVGRAAELDELRANLAGNRLVTLTGPAGSGKTRLAVELVGIVRGAGPAGPDPGAGDDDGAGAAGDDVAFVELAGLTDGERLPSAVAGVLGLREQPGHDLEEVLADNLAGRDVLLVLDNCEHLIDAAAGLVSRLLRAAPRLRVLATSRQTLGVAGEVVVDLPPLPVPGTDDPAEVVRSDAVRLLVQRARAADGRFTVTAANAAAVARIVRRLDGMPLALELAAARLRVFDAGRLADLIDDRFRVLVSTLRTAPARHQTLRAAIAWSYDLLTADEQALFRALSVFEGSFTLEAAERTAAPAGRAIALLPALVERSLVVVDRPERGTRYRLLETLREYGRAQLDPAESRDCRRRHLACYIDLAERAADGLRGPDQLAWLHRLDAERDNLRAALRWSLGHGESAAGLRLAALLGAYWDEQALYDEGTAWLSEALAAPGESPPSSRIQALAGLARLAIGQGRHGHASTCAAASLALARAAGDDRGTVDATTLLGHIALYQSEYAESGRLLREALAAYERLGLVWEQAEVVTRLGHLSRLVGDYAAARAYLERSLALRGPVGDMLGTARVVWQLGVLARYQGDYPRADSLYRDSLARFEAMGDAGGAAHVRYSMGDLARIKGEDALATRLYTTSLHRLREQGDRRCVASILFSLGALALAASGPDQAAPLFGQSLSLRRDLNDQAGVAECLEAFATIDERRGDPTAAVRLLATAEVLRTRTGAARPASDARAHAERMRSLRVAVGAEALATAWAAGQNVDGDVVAELLADS
jgi:predicted ATPase/DNA-binding SARP family transcriptional activator